MLRIKPFISYFVLFAVILVLAIVFIPEFATGKTYYVPKDFATLQEAINEAKDGDTIVAAEGTYKGNINFKGKSITLTSTKPDNPDVVANTIIEGTETGSAVTIDSNATLKGLTIISKDINTKGIYVSNKKSEPKIINCVIVEGLTGAPARFAAGGSKPPQVSDNTSKESTEQPIIFTSEPVNAENEVVSTEFPASGTEDFADTSENTVAPGDSPPIPLEGPAVWYVDDDAPDTGTGTSWEDAFKYLQDALTDTRILPGEEIWVAQGTYKPDQGSDTGIIIAGYTAATFQLINDVTLKGGYAGIGATNPDERNIETYQTILSGDLGNNDLPNFVNYDDNAHHIVKGANTTLEGFIIEGGNSYDSTTSGGGMYNESCSPIIKDCTFRNNRAIKAGGAISNVSASPQIQNCIFSKNRIVLGGRGGGAIFNSDSQSQIDKSIFIDNTSFDGTAGAAHGGAIYSQQGQTEITNCVFSNNNGYYGGAIYNSSTSMTAQNSIFSGNTATRDGGALSDWYSSIIVTNCTFTNNRSNYRGGAIFNIGSTISGNATLTNSVLWDNTDNYSQSINDEIYSVARGVIFPINISYCNIKGGWAGEGNINSNPLFVDANNPAGADGKFFTLDDGLRLRINSPCIDAANGDTALLTDITGLERIDIADIPNTGTGTPNYADIGACESGHDFDSDDLPDEWESFYGLNPYIDDADDDTDTDELSNLEEYQHGTNPINPDTDSDSLTDGQEINTYFTSPLNPDTDSDGMPDGWEVQYGLDPLDPADADDDPDLDGLTNLGEYQHGTNPIDDDTDDDHIEDGWEVSNGFDPLEDSSAEILYSVEENYNKVQDMKTDFIAFSTLNDQPFADTTYSTYYCKAPNKTKMEHYDSPARETKTRVVIIDGTNFFSVNPFTHQYKTIDLLEESGLTAIQFANMDFNYNTDSFITSHSIDLIEEESIGNIYVIEAFPFEANPLYTKLKLYINVSKGLIQKSLLYKDERLMGTKEVTLYEKIGGAWFPKEMVKTLGITTGDFKTTIMYETIWANIGLTDGDFNPETQ